MSIAAIVVPGSAEAGNRQREIDERQSARSAGADGDKRNEKDDSRDETADERKGVVSIEKNANRESEGGRKEGSPPGAPLSRFRAADSLSRDQCCRTNTHFFTIQSMTFSAE